MSHDAQSDNTTDTDATAATNNNNGDGGIDEIKITFRTDGLAEAADSIARELISTFDDELDVPEGDDNALNALFDAHRTSPRRHANDDAKKRRERSRSPPRSSARGLARRRGDQRAFTFPRSRDGGPTSPPSKRFMRTNEQQQQQQQRLSHTPAIASRLRFLAHDACCAGPGPLEFAWHMLEHLPAGADAQCATEAVQKIIDAVHYFHQARQHRDQSSGTHNCGDDYDNNNGSGGGDDDDNKNN